MRNFIKCLLEVSLMKFLISKEEEEGGGGGGGVWKIEHEEKEERMNNKIEGR